MTPPIIDGGNEYERDPRSINCYCISCDKRRKDIIHISVDSQVHIHQNQNSKSDYSIKQRSSSKFSIILFFWNFISIFLCLSILTQSGGGVYALDMMGKEEQQQQSSILLFEDNLENQIPDINDPGGGGGNGAITTTISRDNPLLRHRRVLYQQKSDRQMCHVWNRNSPTDLCNKGKWARLRLLRVLSLWSTDCEKSNVQIGELFHLEWPKIKSESDLISHTEHLKSGMGGRDCLIAEPRSNECLACFNRMDSNIIIMEKAYEAFNHTLRRFDCTIAVDASSATRPFSPNGTCDDCKTWYRKWLLVQLLDIWQEPPCINWCYYAQLACPHIASSRQVDYAGQPSFFCRDLKVSKNVDDHGSRHCKCFHPCDLIRTPPEPLKWFDKNKHRISTIRQYDFFASNDHCWARKRLCDAEKKLEELAIDGSHLTTTIKYENNQLPDRAPSSSASSSSSSSFSGYIYDAPAELFNQLGSWFFPKLLSSSSTPAAPTSNSLNSPSPSSSIPTSSYSKKSTGNKKSSNFQKQRLQQRQQRSSQKTNYIMSANELISSSSSATKNLAYFSSSFSFSSISFINIFLTKSFIFNMPLSFVPLLFNHNLFLLFVFYLLRYYL